MATVLNGSREFSTCSIEQMQPELASSCLDLLVPGDVALRVVSAPTEAIVGEQFTVRVAVDNPSSVDVHGVELTATGTNLEISDFRPVLSRFECSGPNLGCRTATLSSGDVDEIDITMRTVSAAPATLEVNVAALNDPNAANNTASHAIGVRPTVDLIVEIAPAQPVVRPGASVQYSATVRNAGAITATNATVRLEVSPGLLSVAGVSVDTGSCAPIPPPWYTCSLGDIAPGAVHTVRLDARAIGDITPSEFVGASIALEARADQPPTDLAHGSAIESLVIARSVADVRTSVSPALSFQLNSAAEIVVTIENLGPDTAADVFLEQRGGPIASQAGLTTVAVSSNVGSCTGADAPLTFSCAVAALPAGQSLVVAIRGTASQIGQFGTSSVARLASWDPVSTNNAMDSVYSVDAVSTQTPPAGGTAGAGSPPQSGSGGSGGSGGGGGGAADPLYLALLMLALAARRRIVTFELRR
jgi:uncharacterized repeat protein (TIGR01451 family)